ncbi:MAG: sigma-70 family RNA polymerase sigma factor [Pirellulales bacterium]
MKSATIDPKPSSYRYDDSAGALSAASDEELLARYVMSDDREAFSTLVQRFERELFSYLRRYLGDAEMADDVFQATFLQVHLKCGQFEQGRKFRPWLYTVATNQAIDAKRRNKRHVAMSLDRHVTSDNHDDLGALVNLLASSEPSPEAELESDERREWVRREIDSLPEVLRISVVLVYYQGLKYREAADVLDVPVGTVKSRLHSALLKLNAAWSTSRGGDDD